MLTSSRYYRTGLYRYSESRRPSSYGEIIPSIGQTPRNQVGIVPLFFERAEIPRYRARSLRRRPRNLDRTLLYDLAYSGVFMGRPIRQQRPIFNSVLYGSRTLAALGVSRSHHGGF